MSATSRTSAAFVAAVAAAILVWVAIAAAQPGSAVAPRQPADPALGAILLELRGLRADMTASNQRLLSSQLLLGRLQMQEQRIAYLDGQRAQGAAKLDEVLTAVRAMSDRVAQLETGCRNVSDSNERKACDEGLQALKQQIAPFREREQQSRLALLDLENAVAAEQRRWSEFNERLDILERSVAPVNQGR